MLAYLESETTEPFSVSA